MHNELFISTNLPRPLKNEELNKYMEQYKNGDINAREIIINHNIRLVIMCVNNQFKNTPFDMKELVEVGLIGLIKSVDNFDLSKNIKFSSYACRCISNEIRMFLRSWKKISKEESIDNVISIDRNGSELTIGDMLYDEKSDYTLIVENRYCNNEIKKVIDKLDEKSKQIIMMYFGFYEDKTYTQAEIAKKNGTF